MAIDYDFHQLWSTSNLCCPVCLMHYWLVDLIGLFRSSFDNVNQNLTWPLLCIFTLIKLHHMMIQPFQEISLHTASKASSSELWQLYFAELFGNFKFCSLFRGPSVTPIMYSRLNVKERERDLICWQLPPISFKRLLIDNGEGERWTLNRHSNYRL